MQQRIQSWKSFPIFVYGSFCCLMTKSVKPYLSSQGLVLLCIIWICYSFSCPAVPLPITVAGSMQFPAVNEDDILQRQLSVRCIHSLASFWRSSFSSLVISPNGSIYMPFSSPPLPPYLLTRSASEMQFERNKNHSPSNGPPLSLSSTTPLFNKGDQKCTVKFGELHC